MNRLAAGDLSCRDDRGDVEVAVGGRGRTDADGAIRDPRVQRPGIGGGVDRDRLDAQLVQSADDPDRNLAAVRNQNAREHR